MRVIYPITPIWREVVLREADVVLRSPGGPYRSRLAAGHSELAEKFEATQVHGQSERLEVD